MHEADDSSGAKEAPVDDSGRELSKGPGSVSQTTGDGTVPPSSVPSTSLRFGSFEPASAPPRLWSEWVEFDEVFEHTLPALDFEDVVSPVLGASLILVRGEEEEAPSTLLILLRSRVRRWRSFPREGVRSWWSRFPLLRSR